MASETRTASATPATDAEVVPEGGPILLSYSDIQELAGVVARAASEVGLPQVLVAVSRGGLVPAVMVSHLLGVRDLRTVAAVHTVDDGVNAAKSGRPTVDNFGLGAIEGLDVLIVDDIAGSGRTLDAVVETVRAAGAYRVRAAVLTLNLSNWPAGRDDRPDHIGRYVDWWVVFPWETPEPSVPREEGAS